MHSKRKKNFLLTYPNFFSGCNLNHTHFLIWPDQYQLLIVCKATGIRFSLASERGCSKGKLPHIVVVLATIEPPHDKTNKVTVRPAKTQISLGIRPVWSVFTVRMKKPWSLDTHGAHSEDFDQSGRMPRLIGVFADMPFYWFCHDAAHLSFVRQKWLFYCLFWVCK